MRHRTALPATIALVVVSLLLTGFAAPRPLPRLSAPDVTAAYWRLWSWANERWAWHPLRATTTSSLIGWLNGARYVSPHQVTNCGEQATPSVVLQARGGQRLTIRHVMLCSEVAGGVAGRFARGYVPVSVAHGGTYLFRSAKLVSWLTSLPSQPASDECGSWSGTSGSVGAYFTRRFGEIRNCGLYGTTWMLNTVGTHDRSGVAAFYPCPQADALCLNGWKPHPLAKWRIVVPPHPGGVTVLEYLRPGCVLVDDAGWQGCVDVVTETFTMSRG